MALFTDGSISAPMELQNYESGILSVANTEGIDLAAKLTLARDDVANQVMMFLLRRLTVRDFHWNQRRARGLTDVVVTPALKQWHAHKTLALVFRDAYNNQLNDRYMGKWNEYEALAKASSEVFFQIGVGLVGDPLPKPATPILSTTAGPSPAATYYVAVTWVNRASQEGSPSDIGEITTAAGQQPVVEVVSPPSNAIGWNAYVGQSPDGISIQNTVPLGTSDHWVLSTALRPGTPPGAGQQPNWFFVDHRVIERG
ncbi:MAG TPA: hypothetical protein VEV17_14775 [Bryobacteraceae bacterium]|nr:hypothetical protein [Bryobacteraceae bacterium]